jgi:hypothetical protein
VADAQQSYADARAQEGLGLLGLPSDFASLTQAEQIFVLTDVERVERGLAPVAGLDARLDATAMAGAQANGDPGDPPLNFDGVTTQFGMMNWADDADSLGANYEWVYDDGPGSGNLECTPSDHSGCWGHRENILFDVTPAQMKGRVLVAGVAECPAPGKAAAYWNSYAEVIVLGTGKPAHYVYSWAQAVAAGAS